MRSPTGDPSSRSSRRSSRTACRDPRNHEAALEFEELLRSREVTPATIAVLDGIPRIGLDAEGVRRIAEEELSKASVRDLPILAALGAVRGDHRRGDRSPRGARRHPGLRHRRPRRRAPRRIGDLRRVGRRADAGRDADHGRERGRQERARHRGDPRAPRDPERAGRRLRHLDLPGVLAARVRIRARLASRLGRAGGRDHGGPRRARIAARASWSRTRSRPSSSGIPRSTTPCSPRRSPRPRRPGCTARR